MKKILKITFYIIFLSVIVLYLGIVFLFPKTINNKAVIKKVQSVIYNKTGVETNITGFNLKISPKLVFVLKINSIDSKYNNAPVLYIKDVSLNYRLLQNRLTLISANNIYIDGNKLKQFSKTPKKKTKRKFEIKKHPEIHIQNLNYKSDDISIYVQNIDTDNGFIKIKADIKTPYLKETLHLGTSGTLQVVENKFNANKFGLKLGSSQVYLNGLLIDNNKSFNFDLKGEKLPVSELMAILLHFQKSQDPTKKFIENFKNFSGSINLNLTFNNNGIWGKCIANNFGAKAVWFDIPLYAKEIIFNFKGKQVESVAQGKLGKEKVIHKLNITNLGSKDKEVVGSLDSVLTKAFDNVPNLTIKNAAKANIIYKIKYKKIDVFYNVELKPESDLIFNTSYLGLRNYKRKIQAHTLKDGQKLYLKEYKYSYLDSGKENIVISGDGLFLRINDKYTPQYIKCHTNGYAPVSVAGSFGEKLSGGEFKGNLKYNYINDKITGTFDVRNARYKAFIVENALVDAKNNIVNITAKGFLKGQKYTAEMSVKNKFSDNVLVYNMKLFLDKLIIETSPKIHQKHKKISPKEFTKKVQDSGVIVNNWEILINEIRREKFVLEKVKLVGSLKNNIFDFNMDKLDFADGIISANGIYNFAKNTSNMIFEAKDINSNKAANMMLNLENQIEGTANAKVNLYAKDMFRFLDVHSVFEVKEGFLPKLGDTEFAIENSKYKLSQIINYDLANKEEMQFDIKGSLDVHNTEIKNVDITSWSPDSAMYLEGNYEMEKQYADLHLFWKYSKESPKGIKIFYIPLSFILKVVFRPENSKELYKPNLSKIPEINTDEKNTSYYRIKLKGDVNNNKLDIVLKEIK